MSNARDQLTLDGLDCASCAIKIEDSIKNIKGVREASLNFVTKTLKIEALDSKQLDYVLIEAQKVIRKLEPKVIIRHKEIEKATQTLILVGLTCANCVNKIEKEIKNIAGVKAASLDFATQRLTFEAAKHELNRITAEAAQVVQRIEPGIRIKESKENMKVSGHNNKEDKVEDGNRKELIRLTLGALIFGMGLLFRFNFWVEFAIYLASYLLVGSEVLMKAFRNIRRGQVFDENFLMSIATIGAFAIGEFPEGVAVMLFYQIGEYFQDLAVNRSRKSITALMDIRPDYANLKVNEEITKVSPEKVSKGQLIIVKPGERVPLDGKVLDGHSMVDTSALTGESVPREIEPGMDVLSGFINKNGLLTIEVTKEFAESTVAKILDLVENASSRKAPTENFITKFARYYTPVVVIIALLIAIIPPLVLPGAFFYQWFYRALVFLVISCPCALVISIPLGFFGGIGGASKRGILVKGSNYLEALRNAEIVVFDKTGTLTKGVFKVTQIKPSPGFTEEKLLELAAKAEMYSNHPIAESILKAFDKPVNKDEVQNYNEIPGHGLKVQSQGEVILAGNAKLMIKENIPYSNPLVPGTIVHIATNKIYAGYLIISDEIKEDSSTAIQSLKELGIKKTVMLTGDARAVAENISQLLHLDEVHAELLPDQKVERVESLEKEKSPKGKLIFVGDGVNDAPVLARADVGIAMGGLGSDAAIEAADVVIMTDEPSKIATAVSISRKTFRIVWQNIIFAFAVKVIVLILGAGGLATMWEAVFADVGVSLIAVLNAMRVMK
ncbi:Cadmium, zinc and cobalt-transporting ATPase [bioreactor metagenome]|uniref:Cadmium, zinc and cobalt-transporting ATPase n=1 Tax=bioreactor metagenome TaxID=1076179 RepID=A0A644U7T2_9ZZZZ|nr:heavy metal translocating P-type ATPase [Desulfitobacterium hafniense]MEA5024592.1 heavy metal translocating P-type ATPase [Desulfitobacterium hafniense]